MKTRKQIQLKLSQIEKKLEKVIEQTRKLSFSRTKNWDKLDELEALWEKYMQDKLLLLWVLDD